MTSIDGQTLRVLWTILVFAGGLALVWFLRTPLLLLAFAVFFAYLIFPLVQLAQQWQPLRERRTPAIALVYVVLLAALGGVGAALAPRLASEATLLAKKLPEMSAQVQSGTIVGEILERRGWDAGRARQVDAFLRDNARQVTDLAQGAITKALAWLAGAWVIVLVPIFAFFFLKDGDRFAAAAEQQLDRPGGRGAWRGILNDVHHLLGEYVRALILLSLVTAVVWSGVLSIAGVPYALLLAAIGGALEFIPVVGPAVAGVVVMAVALVAGFAHPWLLLLFLILWRFVQDYVTSPLVMGGGVELHPALVIFGVIAGGEIGGAVGAFLAVPVIAAARIVWRRLRGAGEPQPTAESPRVLVAPEARRGAGGS